MRWLLFFWGSITDYLFAFEAVSVLLLIAVIAAVVSVLMAEPRNTPCDQSNASNTSGITPVAELRGETTNCPESVIVPTSPS